MLPNNPVKQGNNIDYNFDILVTVNFEDYPCYFKYCRTKYSSTFHRAGMTGKCADTIDAISDKHRLKKTYAEMQIKIIINSVFMIKNIYAGFLHTLIAVELPANRREFAFAFLLL